MTTRAPILLEGAGAVRVVECFLEGKADPAACEDALVVTPDHVAVIDGMSSPLATADRSASGRTFALAVAQAVLTLPADADARQAVTWVTEALAGIVAAHAGPAGAVAALYSRLRGEVWRVGDVHIAIDGRMLPGEKAVDVAYGQFRAAVNAARLAAGATLADVLNQDPGQEAAAELLRWQHHLANREVAYGYGVLDGSHVPDRHIEVYPVPEGATVVLATDGYLGPAPSLALAERELADGLRRDPACIGELQRMGKGLRGGQTHPDDRTYVRLVHPGGDR